MRYPERRACLRFVVPDALVDWRTAPPSDVYGSDAHVGDISRGGLRFTTPGPPPVGAALDLALRIPGVPPVHVTGRVAWSTVASGQFHAVGVAFAPYGDAPGLNPPSVLDLLTAIERRSVAAP